MHPETAPRIRRLASVTCLTQHPPSRPDSAQPAVKHGSIQRTVSREARETAFLRIVTDPLLDAEHRTRVRSAASAGSQVSGYKKSTAIWAARTDWYGHACWNIRLLLGLPIPGLRTREECTTFHSSHRTNGVQRFHHCPTSTGMWQRRHNETCTELARWLNKSLLHEIEPTTRCSGYTSTNMATLRY